MIRPTGKGTRTVPLTEARARLFPLVDDLLAGRTDRVVLSRRGADERVLLVRARDVERMEAELAELRRRVAPEPQPLWGIATVDGEVEDILGDIRREADASFERRMASIFDDPAAAPEPPPQGGESAPSAPPATPAARSRRRG